MCSNQNQVTTIDEDEGNFLFALQLGTSSVLPMVLRAVVELDVFEIIAKAGVGAQLSAKEIADNITTKNVDAPVMLDRILHLLASSSILISNVVAREDGTGERLYGLAPVCKYFVRNEDGVSLAPLLMLAQDKVFMDSWYHLKDAIVEGGIPFNRVHGVHAFELPGIDPRFNEVFNQAMFNHSTIIMKKILDRYKGFENIKELVDVGGGLGTTLKIITSKYPTIKSINFDLPHVIDGASSYPGVEHVGGDMFASVPKAEAIFMKWILHDWSDEKCGIVLKNCYEELPEHGKLIVVESILPLEPETTVAAKTHCQLDLVMMAQNPGGKERTEQEFKTLANLAGFAGVNKVCSTYNYSVMEFYKK